MTISIWLYNFHTLCFYILVYFLLIVVVYFLLSTIARKSPATIFFLCFLSALAFLYLFYLFRALLSILVFSNAQFYFFQDNFSCYSLNLLYLFMFIPRFYSTVFYIHFEFILVVTDPYLIQLFQIREINLISSFTKKKWDILYKQSTVKMRKFLIGIINAEVESWTVKNEIKVTL